MGFWENSGESNEWYTPKYIFDALDCRFDLDAAAPWDRTMTCVPADNFISANSFSIKWEGFTWLNPPFGGRNSKGAWLEKMACHGDGIVLVPDRTSCDWWQEAAHKCASILFVAEKIKFIRPKIPAAPWFLRVDKLKLIRLAQDKKTKIVPYDGSPGDSPSTGTTLFAYGRLATEALMRAESNGLGIVVQKIDLRKKDFVKSI